MQTIRVEGSHGALQVHGETGFVIRKLDGCRCDECDGGYGDIAMFDTVDLRREAHLGDVLDVLYLGYWTRGGVYEPATVQRTVHTRRWGMDYDATVTMAYLPAPISKH